MIGMEELCARAFTTPLPAAAVKKLLRCMAPTVTLSLRRHAEDLLTPNPGNLFVFARRTGNLGFLHPLRLLHYGPAKLDLLQISRDLVKINVASVLHGL